MGSLRPTPTTTERTAVCLEAGLADGVGAVGEDTLVYDGNASPRRLTKDHFERLVRKLKILRWLDRLPCESFLDIGSGPDCLPAIVRARRGTDAYYADLVHATNLPHDGERLGKLDHAVTIDVARLPFRDGAFDVIVASEVLEHLVRPVEALAELVRVARRAVLLTSLEALSRNRMRRALSHLAVDVRRPHVERNFFTLDELQLLLGPSFHHEALFSYRHAPASPFWPAERIDAVFAAIQDRATLESALVRAAASVSPGDGTMGIALAWTAPGVELAPSPPGGDAALARWLVDEVASLEYYAFAVLCAHGALCVRPDLEPAGPSRNRPVAPALLARLQCPDCRCALEQDPVALRCAGCSARFATEYGVPVLYPTAPHDGPAEREAAVRALCAGDAGRARAVHRLAARLRRNEPPPGPVRRAAWRLEQALGSPLRRRGLWPAE